MEYLCKEKKSKKGLKEELMAAKSKKIIISEIICIHFNGDIYFLTKKQKTIFIFVGRKKKNGTTLIFAGQKKNICLIIFEEICLAW